MVRPKASEANLRVALSFAHILIAREKLDDTEEQTSRVLRKGPRSLFAAFRACFPDLARYSRQRFPKNRQAVSMIELNKGLCCIGLTSRRKRERTEDGVRKLHKVFISFRRYSRNKKL
jgi:hypothetical protein